MKRFLSIFTCLALLLSMGAIFAACDEKDEPAATTTAATTVSSGESDEDLDNSSEKPSKKPATTTYVPSPNTCWADSLTVRTDTLR